ncbi:hypothetical protein N0V90_005464 [Kalmusia sp. IMI 367209]|nr:hypothetical protein N0V90_005464 [Kalmusia sp. IMI 367209]
MFSREGNCFQPTRKSISSERSSSGYAGYDSVMKRVGGSALPPVEDAMEDSSPRIKRPCATTLDKGATGTFMGPKKRKTSSLERLCEIQLNKSNFSPSTKQSGLWQSKAAAKESDFPGIVGELCREISHRVDDVEGKVNDHDAQFNKHDAMWKAYDSRFMHLEQVIKETPSVDDLVVRMKEGWDMELERIRKKLSQTSTDLLERSTRQEILEIIDEALQSAKDEIFRALISSVTRVQDAFEAKINAFEHDQSHTRNGVDSLNGLCTTNKQELEAHSQMIGEIKDRLPKNDECLANHGRAQQNLLTRIDDLQAKHNNVKVHHKTCMDILNRRCLTSHQKISDLQAEITNIGRGAQELKQTTADTASMSLTVNAILTRLQSVEKDSKESKCQIEELNDQVTTAKKESQRCETSIATLQGNYNASEKRRIQLTGHHDDLRQDCVSLAQQHKSLVEDHLKLKQKYDSLGEAHKVLERNHQCLEQRHEALVQAQDSLKRTFKSLKADSTAAVLGNHSMRESTSETTKRIEHEQAVTRQDAMIKKLESGLATLENDHKDHGISLDRDMTIVKIALSALENRSTAHENNIKVIEGLQAKLHDKQPVRLPRPLSTAPSSLEDHEGDQVAQLLETMDVYVQRVNDLEIKLRNLTKVVNAKMPEINNMHA